MRIHPFVGLSLIAVLILPVILLYPFHGDNHTYQSMAVVLVRYHGLPYLASWDQNFPGIILFHAAAIELFGNSESGFRLIEYLVQVGCVLALYRVCRLWLSPATSLLSCILYAAQYVSGPILLMGQREGFATPILLLYTYLIIDSSRAAESHTLDTRGMLRFASAGIVLGCAAVIRPTFALFLFPPFLSVADIRTSTGRKSFVAVVAGFLLTLGIVILPYATTTDGLRQLYLTVIRFNLDVYGGMFERSLVANRAYVLLAFILFWSGVVLLNRVRNRHIAQAPSRVSERWYIVLSVASAIIGIIVMRKFYGYHFIVVFALLIPVLTTLLVDWASSGVTWRSILLALIIGTVAIVSGPVKLAQHFLIGPPKAANTNSANAGDPNLGEIPEQEVAKYINGQTSGSDKVEFASYSAAIKWRLRARPVTRFTTMFPLVTPQRNGEFTSYQREWRSEFVETIRRERPKLVVLQALRLNPFVPDSVTTLPVMLDLPGFRELLLQRYHLDTVLKRCYIYREYSSVTGESPSAR